MSFSVELSHVVIKNLSKCLLSNKFYLSKAVFLALAFLLGISA